MNTDELKIYFSKMKLEGPIHLGPGETIADPQLFIQGHLNVLSSYPPDSKVSVPFHDRLMKLREMIKAGKVSVIYLD